MARSKKIKIDDREITVNELKVKDIRALLEIGEDIDVGTPGAFFEKVGEYLPRVTNLTLDDMDEMAPSELRRVWDVFAEVNENFLAAVRESGLVAVLVDSISTNLTASFAAVLNEGTGGSSTTAGAPSDLH